MITTLKLILFIIGGLNLTACDSVIYGSVDPELAPIMESLSRQYGIDFKTDSIIYAVVEDSQMSNSEALAQTEFKSEFNIIKFNYETQVVVKVPKSTMSQYSDNILKAVLVHEWLHAIGYHDHIETLWMLKTRTPYYELDKKDGNDRLNKYIIEALDFIKHK